MIKQDQTERPAVRVRDAAEAAREALGGYHAYASFVLLGKGGVFAAEQTGGGIGVHAARLAAELESVLAVAAELGEHQGDDADGGTEDETP